MKILLSAGGPGTKIWPLSTKNQPKQFQKIIGDKSLFTNNIEMLLEKYRPEDIYVSTKKRYAEFAFEQAPQLPKENFILEPDAFKGRGPGEGYAVLYLSIHAPNEPFTMLQADCMYLPHKKYFKTIDIMNAAVQKDKKLISGGMQPKFPVLGVDYLLLGEKVVSEQDTSLYKVKKFLGRKDDYYETEKLLNQETAVIHTNLNTWYPELMLEAYKKYKPDWYEKLMEIKKVMQTTNDEKEIDVIYETFIPGVTEEVTKNVFDEGYIITFGFKWVDVGTWDSLYKHLASENEVYSEGNVVALDSEGSLVKSTNAKKLVAVMGLKDMVVVDTEDILFIAPRDKVGEMKKVHKELEDRGLDHFL